MAGAGRVHHNVSILAGDAACMQNLQARDVLKALGKRMR
jgi:hypothetical protein